MRIVAARETREAEVAKNQYAYNYREGVGDKAARWALPEIKRAIERRGVRRLAYILLYA